MRLFQDGVEVEILPDCAMCKLDDKLRSPLDIPDDECPLGEEFCSGDCCYYDEDYDGTIRKEKEAKDNTTPIKAGKYFYELTKKDDKNDIIYLSIDYPIPPNNEKFLAAIGLESYTARQISYDYFMTMADMEA